MPGTVDVSAAERFYRAALTGLLWLESVDPTGRRFGPEADAKWKGFVGHLTTTDRIDLLLRDAAVTWGAAFSPAALFRLPGLAADEPFGPDWPVLPEDRGRRLWREALETGSLSWDAAWARAAAGWGGGVGSARVDLGQLTPATRLLIAGPSAVTAAVGACATRDDLRWAEQAVVVAGAPGARHLAALGGLFARNRGITRLVAPGDAGDDLSPADVVRRAGLSSLDRLILSDDADPADRDFARAAADGLGV